MSIKDKIARAEKESCFTDLYTDEEWATKKTMSLVAAEIEFARANLGKSQKEFAEFMGVTQGMVSRWESGTYNFTIEALSRIAFRLGRSLESFLSAAKPVHDGYIDADKVLASLPTQDIFKRLAKDARIRMKPKKAECFSTTIVADNDISEVCKGA